MLLPLGSHALASYEAWVAATMKHDGPAFTYPLILLKRASASMCSCEPRKNTGGTNLALDMPQLGHPAQPHSDEPAKAHVSSNNPHTFDSTLSGRGELTCQPDELLAWRVSRNCCGSTGRLVPSSGCSLEDAQPIIKQTKEQAKENSVSMLNRAPSLAKAQGCCFLQAGCLQVGRQIT